MADQSQIDLFYTLKPAPGQQAALQRQMTALEKGLQFKGPLFGGQTRQISDFTNQMDRANQRVITLGASFAVLYTSIRVFKEIVNATVAVEKSLTDINAVFKLTSSNLDQFGRNLFNVARNTSQSFEKVAEAAKPDDMTQLANMINDMIIGKKPEYPVEPPAWDSSSFSTRA